MSKPFDVVIVGAGPAGCTLGALLVKRGFQVLCFDNENRPELLVGESLLPTVVELMRKLEIEERARQFCQRKPGVAFEHRDGQRLDFIFSEEVFGETPAYTYNVPRPAFDNLLLERARELGVVFVKAQAEVVKGQNGREVELSPETLAATAELAGKHPRLLVDATGRARLFARTLGLTAMRGGRNDVAYFAHYTGFEDGCLMPGQVVISILERGWAWRIPLPGELSVGVVIDKWTAKKHGTTPEQRLESVIKSDPVLAKAGVGRQRVTEVKAYSNYQLISKRAHGPGWLAAGDSFGFVDPMLSPGLFMAMHMADLLDQRVFSRGLGILEEPERLGRLVDQVQKIMMDWHDAWGEVIEYFYDGRIFSLYEARDKIRASQTSRISQKLERHLSDQVTKMVAGVKTRSQYARHLLRFFSKYLVWDTHPPEHYAVQVGEEIR